MFVLPVCSFFLMWQHGERSVLRDKTDLVCPSSLSQMHNFLPSAFLVYMAHLNVVATPQTVWPHLYLRQPWHSLAQAPTSALCPHDVSGCGWDGFTHGIENVSPVHGEISDLSFFSAQRSTYAAVLALIILSLCIDSKHCSFVAHLRESRQSALTGMPPSQLPANRSDCVHFLIGSAREMHFHTDLTHITFSLCH